MARITPLHSTREDVERVVGSPMTPGWITYDLKTERVNIVYSAGVCKKGRVRSGTFRLVRLLVSLYIRKQS